MTRRIKARRDQAVKRRNPVARALRDAAYRARQEANRLYQRAGFERRDTNVYRLDLRDAG